MGIFESEEVLFAEWREKRPGFVADGAVDEEAYLSSRIKLMFVLKEVNDDPDGGEWDLRQFLRDGGRSQTWDNITRWIYGIRQLPSDIEWSKIADIDKEKRINTLRSIVAVNLKKSPGGHTTVPVELAMIADEDKLYLNRQLCIYDPDIIVCCGTSETFHWLVNICENTEKRVTKRGIKFHEYRKGKFVVEYLHPQARCASHLLYYGLVDALREILSNNN